VSEVAFVTGGAAGFGRALAASFAADGVAVVLADIDLGAAQTAAKAIVDSGGSALAVHCDVADAAAVERAVARAVAEFGGIDILINNAALHLSTYSLPYAQLGLTRIQNCLQVNVMGIVHCTLAARATMAARGNGRIVNLSSSAGYEPRSIYGVTKLAVRGLTTSFAAELAPDGIRVNAVAPGLMATEAALADLDSALFERYAADLQLVKRRGEMSDIVSAIRFLSSGAASFITGETLQVTGGHPLQP
jgi:3-oxoacyl-[acyl-carrier protein] reductase